jgi:hypothetical protein
VVTRRAAWRRAGGVRLGCMLFTFVIAVAAYVAAYVGQSYWKYYQFQDAFKNEAKFATHYSDKQIKEHLRSMADSLLLPDDAYDIDIDRSKHHIDISGQYYDHVKLGPVSRDFYYSPHGEADF